MSTDIDAMLRFLKVFQSLVVSLELLLQDRVFVGSSSLVVVQFADAVESLEVQPATELHADAVDDEMRLDVNLRGNESEN
jgi:hypothetical protein